MHIDIYKFTSSQENDPQVSLFYTNNNAISECDQQIVSKAGLYYNA